MSRTLSSIYTFLLYHKNPNMLSDSKKIPLKIYIMYKLYSSAHTDYVTYFKKEENQMTKKSIWLIILTAFVISVVIVFGSMTAMVTNPKPETFESTETATTQTEVIFVLRTWDNHLGLFRGDSETPYSEIDMPLYLLTEHDRKMLEQGIKAQNEDELRTLVEDITS